MWHRQICQNRTVNNDEHAGELVQGGIGLPVFFRRAVNKYGYSGDFGSKSRVLGDIFQNYGNISASGAIT